MGLLDLATQDSIWAFVIDFISSIEELDVSISNAGIMGVPESYVDRLESHRNRWEISHAYQFLNEARIITYQ